LAMAKTTITSANGTRMRAFRNLRMGQAFGPPPR
jgi:hypothetical protein